MQTFPTPARHVLAWSIALPAVYFGSQVVASPFYPGYSFLSHDASTLGSTLSTAPWIFNVGMLTAGAIEMILAGVLAVALPRAGVGRGLSLLVAAALASAAIGSVNAFLHPLPDPRHTDGLLFLLGGGLALLPPLAAAVLWRLHAHRAAVLTAVAYLALIPLMTGLIQRACMAAGIGFAGYQNFLNHDHGVIQRLGAAVFFAPVAVVAYRLRRSMVNR